MKVYQVLNSSGLPASNETNDLCIFKAFKDAQAYIKYLTEGCGRDKEPFTIKTVVLTELARPSFTLEIEEGDGWYFGSPKGEGKQYVIKQGEKFICVSSGKNDRIMKIIVKMLNTREDMIKAMIQLLEVPELFGEELSQEACQAINQAQRTLSKF